MTRVGRTSMNYRHSSDIFEFLCAVGTHIHITRKLRGEIKYVYNDTYPLSPLDIYLLREKTDDKVNCRKDLD